MRFEKVHNISCAHVVARTHWFTFTFRMNDWMNVSKWAWPCRPCMRAWSSIRPFNRVGLTVSTVAPVLGKCVCVYKRKRLRCFSSFWKKQSSKSARRRWLTVGTFSRNVFLLPLPMEQQFNIVHFTECGLKMSLSLCLSSKPSTIIYLGGIKPFENILFCPDAIDSN